MEEQDFNVRRYVFNSSNYGNGNGYMPCYNPIEGYQQTDKNVNGKRPIRFSKGEAFKHNRMLLPCGKCVGCQLEYARQWAVRCYHEAQMHKENCFITLTYNEENAPEDRCVSKREVQLFIKRLRKALGKKVKYFAAGEYGEKGWKPHYHLIIFGYDFPDKILHGWSPKGNELYVSKQLGKLWTKGYHSIGKVTIESASYTARYCMKKLDIETNEDGTIPLTDKATGETWILEPEFTLKSSGNKKGQALGASWFARYWKDVYPKDFITIEGNKHKPPQYYDKLMEEIDIGMIERVKMKRMVYVKKQKGEQTVARAYVKEEVKKASISIMTRDLEK